MSVNDKRLLVNRKELRETRVVEAERPEIADGQALLRVERFGLTANNVTYAAFGEAMRYWEFFPTGEEGWGHLPLWGFAEVEDSKAAGVEAGGRIYGYLPSSRWLLTEPAGVRDGSFTDAVAHRATLPSAYQGYVATGDDPFYTNDSEELQMLLRPLWYTSWLLADELQDGGMAGARTAIFSSASSKTALGTAFALKQEGAEIEIVGLTSSRSRGMVEDLDLYDRVEEYDAAGTLGVEATYVDFSGDGALRFAVHEGLGDSLRASVAVGATSWDELGARGGDTLPGPQPRLFFAPDRVTKRGGDWGREGLNTRVADAWHPFAKWVGGWLEVEAAEGFGAAESTYLELLDNGVGPQTAHVFSLSGVGP